VMAYRVASPARRSGPPTALTTTNPLTDGAGLAAWSRVNDG